MSVLTKSWIRSCKLCNKLIRYGSYKGYWNGCKFNSVCRSCSKIGNVGRKGQKCSPEHIERTRLSHIGMKTTEQTRIKQRLSAIKRIERKFNKCHPYANYNPIGCKYFDELSKEKGWNLQHAGNGGEFFVKELGYWLDAYDKNKNIVVEYDEPRHNRPSVKKKDLIRQQNIINKLQCEFYRFNESNNILEKIV